MQSAVGLICVVLGLLHFVDRGRPHEASHSYYIGIPTTPTARALLALVEIAAGFVLLLTV